MHVLPIAFDIPQFCAHSVDTLVFCPCRIARLPLQLLLRALSIAQCFALSLFNRFRRRCLAPAIGLFSPVVPSALPPSPFVSAL
eukprot:4659399-Pleurochrysis_carterae.AAC.1